ncbi:chaplin [Streptomyces niger]|uniref:chaplin n=1 Tax=Streptomyces niger TaxID=66373 RepID=UPI00069AB21F|nr:chaplin [Streptomyces niger]
MSIRTALVATALAAATVLGGATASFADAGAGGTVANSPGLLSGNAVQVPVDLPVNVCGTSVDVIGLLNPADSNSCVADVHQGKHHGGWGHGRS